MSPWLCVCTIEVSWGRFQTSLKIVLLCSAEESKQVKLFFFSFLAELSFNIFQKKGTQNMENRPLLKQDFGSLIVNYHHTVHYLT